MTASGSNDIWRYRLHTRFTSDPRFNQYQIYNHCFRMEIVGTAARLEEQSWEAEAYVYWGGISLHSWA